MEGGHSWPPSSERQAGQECPASFGLSSGRRFNRFRRRTCMNPEKETRAMNAKEGIDTALTIGVARYPIQSFCLGVRCALGVKSNGIFQVQRSRGAPGPMPQTVRRREKMPGIRGQIRDFHARLQICSCVSPGIPLILRCSYW